MGQGKGLVQGEEAVKDKSVGPHQGHGLVRSMGVDAKTWSWGGLGQGQVAEGKWDGKGQG